MKDNIGTVEIGTANGIIETEVFEIDTFASIGLTKEKFQIQVYDFIAHGIFSEYNDLLGLDFLEGQILHGHTRKYHNAIMTNSTSANKSICKIRAGQTKFTISSAKYICLV